MNIQNNYPERIIPDQVYDSAYANHLKRYDFARQFTTNKRVLDVACGVGYGSDYLAAHASSVVGVDLADEAIAYARQHYLRHGVAFAQADALRLPFADASFDVVCSFETIEHVPEVAPYLQEVRRVLRPNGVYLVSTPAAKATTRTPPNPHHVQEWSPADFEVLIRQYFDHVELYSQYEVKQAAVVAIKRADRLNLRLLIPKSLRLRIARLLKLRTMYDARLDHMAITPGLHPDAAEVVAVCR